MPAPVSPIRDLAALRRSPRVLTARRIAAAVLAAGALVLAVAPQPTRSTAASEPARTAVLVAARDLPAGTAIGADDLQAAQRTTAHLPDGALDPATDVVGRVITGPVRRGEVITDRRLLGPGLSAGLGPGIVASPVRLVDLEVAALLRPGDRVDILAATEGASSAAVVAPGALVLAVPLGRSDGSQPAEPLGLVVLAVDRDTASRLAAAAAASVLTATLLAP